jgi:hypothetical protein
MSVSPNETERDDFVVGHVSFRVTPSADVLKNDVHRVLEGLVKKVKVSRAALRQEAQERVDLFLAIGEFIFEFSQLEFTIRFALATALNIPEGAFSAVTSMYDFAALCRVTRAVLDEAEAQRRVAEDQETLSDVLEGLPTREDQEKLRKEIAKVFNACLKVNDERVRITHGTWTIGGGARHVSRTSLKAQDHFEKPERIVEITREIEKLRVSVIRLLGFKP